MKMLSLGSGVQILTLSRLLTSEIYKFLTSRQSVLLLGIGVTTSPALSLVFVNLQTNSPQAPSASLFFESLAISAIPFALFVAVISALNFSQELGTSEIDFTRMASPRRVQIAIAKTFTNLLFAVFGSVGAIASSLLAIRLVFSTSVVWPGETACILKYGLLQLMSFALIALLASFLSFISRNTVSATIHAILLLLVLPSVLQFFPSVSSLSLTSLTPIVCVQSIATENGARPFTLQGIEPSSLSSGQSFLVLLCWVLLYALLASRYMLRESFGRHAKVQKPKAGGVDSAANGESPRPRGTFLPALKSSLYVFSSDRLVRIFAIVFVATSFVVAVEQRFSMSNQDYADTSPQLVALFERSAYLTAPVQAQVLQISFMASSMAIREFLGDFTQSQFLAIPNRFRWITVRALAAICVFSVLTLVSFTLNVSALALTTNLADILQPEALNQMVWILLHQVVAIALCGLIAFSAGMLLMSTGATLTFVSSLFILIPSVLQSLSDGFRLSGQQVLSNLWTMFPVGFQAVRWLPEHSFMPQFLITGQLLISPSQELLIMSFWAVLITSLAFVRVTTKSLRRDSL